MKNIMNIILIIAIICGSIYAYREYKKQHDNAAAIVAINTQIRQDIAVALAKAQTSQDSVDILKTRLAQLRKQAATINHPPITIPPIDSPTIITLCDTIRYKNVIDTLNQALVIADEIIHIDEAVIDSLTIALLSIPPRLLQVDTLVLRNRPSIISKMILVGTTVLIVLAIK